ncbi:hypothetical protein [Paenibacillus taichungensis]
MTRKIKLMDVGEGTKNFTIVSGIEELNGAHILDTYETHYDMMTYHEEKAIIFNISAKYDLEDTSRQFTVVFHAENNKNSLLSTANGSPIFFTGADNDLIKPEMLGVELQLELFKAGAVHINVVNPITQMMITEFVNKYA